MSSISRIPLPEKKPEKILLLERGSVIHNGVFVPAEGKVARASTPEKLYKSLTLLLEEDPNAIVMVSAKKLQ